MAERLFHYTVGNHISKIITDGFIKVETDGGLPFKEQPPAVGGEVLAWGISN